MFSGPAAAINMTRTSNSSPDGTRTTREETEDDGEELVSSTSEGICFAEVNDGDGPMDDAEEISAFPGRQERAECEMRNDPQPSSSISAAVDVEGGASTSSASAGVCLVDDDEGPMDVAQISATLEQQELARMEEAKRVEKPSSNGSSASAGLCLADGGDGPINIAEISAALEQQDLAEKAEVRRVNSQMSSAVIPPPRRESSASSFSPSRRESSASSFSPSRRESSASSDQTSLVETNLSASVQELTMSPTDGDGLNGQASAQRAFGMDSAGLASVPSSIMAEAYAVPDSPVFTASIVEIIPWYKQKRYVCIFLMIAMIMLIGVVAAAVRLPVGGKQPSIVYVNVTDGPTETVLDNVTDGPTESLPAWIDGNYQATAGNGLDLAKFNRIKDRILERGISHVATLESPISPQYKALRWIVRDDKRQFDLTTQDDESNTIAENEIDDERALFQRYALAVLWHQTNDLQVVRESLSGEEIANVFDEGYTPVALTKEDIEWNQSTNWMSEKGLCLWHGVTCHPHEQLGEKFDGDFYVAILNITSNNIHGILPREVYTAFNRMVALDVSKNRFAGPIAGDIGMLSELQDLLLFENGFSGNIPQEIGQLSNLFNLYLNDNKFMGQLPSQLGTMWKLRGVSMFNNSLDGRVPPGLGNLKNLIALYLDTNKFTGQIPKSFGGMTGMIDLRLRQNDFSGSVPSELGELKQLETLYLDTNPRIKGSIPSELGGLVKLSELHLYQMNLNGKLPSELGLLEGLVYLYLDSNELTGNIPEEWGGMRDLEELFLTGNNLVGPLPQTIRGMKNLKTLRAADNDLAGPLPADLSKLMKLEYVYLDNNDFSGAIPTELGLLKKLKTMHLHSSKLTGEMPQEVCSLKTEYLLQDLRVDCDEVACTCCTCDE